MPRGPDKTTTDTAALLASGLVATPLLDKATSGGRFLADVADTLGPVLERGDTVILDNLSVHAVAGARETIEALGARALDLPADGPDFDPIDPSTGSG